MKTKTSSPSWLLLIGLALCTIANGSVEQSILKPDGTPATGASAVLVPRGHWVRSENGESFDNDPAYQRCAADENGRVHFPGMPSPFLLVVIDPSGYAKVDEVALRSSNPVRLVKWSRVRGRLMIGNRPAAGEEIGISLLDPANFDPGRPQWLPLGHATTDADGRFDIHRIVAGSLHVVREINFKVDGELIASTSTQRKIVTVRPGETMEVALGGMGRPVVGAVTFPQELAARTDRVFDLSTASSVEPKQPLPMPDDVRSADLSVQQKWYANFVQTDAGKAYLAAQDQKDQDHHSYPINIETDGSFRIDDVIAGRYQLHIGVRGNFDRPSKHGTPIATGEAEFVVPEMPEARSDDPLHIGNVTLHMLPHVPQIGDKAPDFAVKSLAGKDLKLSDFRGRFVLLDFWATWCGPCLSSTPTLKKTWDQFGRDGPFTIISLSIDDQPFAPGRYVDEQHISWPQGFLGRHSDTEKQYGVHSIPSFWIIDPSGNIAAKPANDADLPAALANAVSASQAGRKD